NVEFEDLVSWGYQGLLEARERFDPNLDATFSSYAYYRIRGAMIDGLCRTGWAMRGSAIQLRDALAINDYLENQAVVHQRAPKPDTFEDSVTQLEQSVGDCVMICLLGAADLDRVATGVAPVQVEQIATQDLRRELGQALRQLA